MVQSNTEAFFLFVACLEVEQKGRAGSLSINNGQISLGFWAHKDDPRPVNSMEGIQMLIKYFIRQF